MQTLAHPEGEVATSKACATSDTLMGLSNYSTTELERVIAEGKSNPYIMQMSLILNKPMMVQMIKRAEGEIDTALCRSTEDGLRGLLTDWRFSCWIQGALRHP